MGSLVRYSAIFCFGLDQGFVFLLSFHLRAHRIACSSSQSLFSPACQKPPMLQGTSSYTLGDAVLLMNNRARRRKSSLSYDPLTTDQLVFSHSWFVFVFSSQSFGSSSHFLVDSSSLPQACSQDTLQATLSVVSNCPCHRKNSGYWTYPDHLS